jgi:hypothetical protein
LQFLNIYGTDQYKHIDGKKVCFGFGYVENVTVNEGITSIVGGNNMGFACAFSGLGAAMSDAQPTEIDLPNSLVNIEAAAFNKAKIRNLFLPNNVRNIGKNAFEGLNARTVSFNGNLLEIGQEAFKNATIASKTIFITKDVSIIGRLAFSGCELDRIIVDGQNNYYTTASNVGEHGYVVVDKANNGLLLRDCSNIVGSLAAGEVHLSSCGYNIENTLDNEAFMGSSIRSV